MLQKIYNKLCHIVCRLLKITPCLCKHDCNCKKEENNG